MTVRAKFKCNDITNVRTQYVENAILRFTPVTDGAEEDKAFWGATPSGSLEMSCMNPDTVAQFTPGKSYYLDFTEAE